MKNYLLFGLSLLFLLFSSGYGEPEKYISFKVVVYKDAKCNGKLAGPEIIIDAAKSCNSYSYVDSKGVTTTGSVNHVRCYKGKVVFDQYSFSGKCLASESFYKGKQYVTKNHSLRIGVCQKDASHDGPVYEKLSGYIYPGRGDCKKNLV